jgi:hypothetical protein
MRAERISQLRYMKTRMSGLQTGLLRFIQSIFEEGDILFFFFVLREYKDLFTELTDPNLNCCETSTAKRSGTSCEYLLVELTASACLPNVANRE